MTIDVSAARWRRVEALLDAALAREPAAREAYLDAQCADDPELRREVASLLAAHERPGAVDRLAADLAPLAARVRDSAAPLAGRAVGPYRIVGPLAGGGMGVVYEAVDARLDRRVALKFLRPRLGPDDSAAERFRLEARAIAALEHPNVCTLHEIGETEDGQLFLAMPLYDGETLQRRIARGPLPIGEAVAVGVQIARGLAKAHARGIVHRDIKPSNVLVTTDGVVKILDFGIAKLSDVTLTGAAGPLGTAAYMSPEQTRGSAVDHRTDLWSLGVVLYEMLAGRRPFDGASSDEVSSAIRHADPVPLAEVRPDVPPALAALVATALAKSPDARHASAHALERELLALGLAGEVPGGAPPLATTGRSAAARRRALRTAAATLLPLLALGGAGAWWATGARRDAAAGATVSPTAARATIAVLPFVDHSPGGDQEYFSDGISEELIATLARVDGLRVASRSSAFAFKGRDVDVRTVGTRLGVATVLEGSVRRSGERLRITAQLVDVADGHTRWSEAYDRDAGDAFAIQQEIARAIAQTLRLRLVGGETPGDGKPHPDAEAYDLYLRGRHALYQRGRFAWHSRTEEGLRAAARYFEEAVAQSPDYARAHAGLADAWAVLGFYDYAPPRDAFPRAERAATRAIALDPRLAAPHATLGYAALYHRWDFARSEEAFRRAIALDPSYSTAHQWYGNLLTAAGRPADAVRALRRAQEADPLSLIATAALGWAMYHGGDQAGALEQFRQTLELNPDYVLAHLWRGWALQELDSLPAAVAAHRRAVALSNEGALFTAALARSLALAGERVEAESLLTRLEARAGGGYVPSYEVAKVHEALGRPERALDWLERAHRERSHSLVFLRVDPQLARLRGHPRFARLAARVLGG
jgi:serine/threonine-protein kinase